MKKLIMCLSIVLVLGLTVAAPSFAGHADMSHSGAFMGNMHPQTSFNAFRASDLIGKDVMGQQGEKLGNIQDVIIGQDGRVNFVILSRAGTTASNQSLVPVPWRAFMTSGFREDRNGTLIADLSRDKLDNAPSFTSGNWPNLSSSEWQRNVYSYYGMERPAAGRGMQDMEYEHGNFNKMENREFNRTDRDYRDFNTPNAGGTTLYNR